MSVLQKYAVPDLRCELTFLAVFHSFNHFRVVMQIELFSHSSVVSCNVQVVGWSKVVQVRCPSSYPPRQDSGSTHALAPQQLGPVPSNDNINNTIPIRPPNDVVMT